MRLQCDASCVGARHVSAVLQPVHTYMARAALIFGVIHRPTHSITSGTFKETMGDDTLEIMFVPVYLSALSPQAIFCGVYVFFYERNLLRVSILTAINFMLLWMNNYASSASIGSTC